MRIGPIAIHHYRPYKEWEDSLGELLEVFAEVEDAMIIKGDRHTDIVERWRIALIVLDGIYVGVEHIRTVENALRLMGAALNKIVVIGIDTGYHIATKRLALEKIHQYRLLAASKIHLRWQHHLEVTLVVLELAQNRSPEVDIVIALDIGHYPMSCSL